MKKIFANHYFLILILGVSMLSCSSDDSNTSTFLHEELVKDDWKIELPYKDGTKPQYLRINSISPVSIDVWEKDGECYDYTLIDELPNFTLIEDTESEFYFRIDFTDYDYSNYIFKKNGNTITYSHYNYFRGEEFDLVPQNNLEKANNVIDDLVPCQQ